MEKLLLPIGRLAGAAGILICIISALARLLGHHWLGGVETLSLFQAGIGGTVIGCFCLLLVLTQNSR